MVTALGRSETLDRLIISYAATTVSAGRFWVRRYHHIVVQPCQARPEQSADRFLSART